MIPTAIRPELRTLSSNDSASYSEITELAYNDLLARPNVNKLVSPHVDHGVAIGELGVCDEASDAVTRAAHKLGIIASREFHQEGYHYLTSFAPLDRAPHDDDPILCMTWGQFDPVAYQQHQKPFFGTRKDMHDLIGASNYQEGFSASSVALRQITHTPAREPYNEHVWLATTPDDISSSYYPLGKVPPSSFEWEEWEFPSRLPRE